MKILQIIQRPQLRGAEVFACQLSVELQKLGHQVDMLFLFGNESQLLPFELSFFHLEANEQKRWWDIGAYKRLSKLIAKGGYDIVQANAGDTLKYAALSKKLFGWKSKLVFRNANKISDFLTSNSKKKLNGWLVKEVDFVASVSEECKVDFQQAFNFPGDKTESLPIGVNTGSTASYNTLSEIGIKGTGPFILSVASFVPEKNHQGLIRIFAAVLKVIPEAKLLLVGEGKLKDATTELVNQLQLGNAVSFLGSRTDVLQLMGCCHAFVLPSLIEGLPAVILEAFQHRLPVIAYNVGGIKEVVFDKRTGWLVNKNDEAGFVKALTECLNGPSENIKQEAFKLVTEKFSNQQIAMRFLGFYQQILAS